MEALASKEAYHELLQLVTETQQVRLNKMLIDVGVPEAKHGAAIWSATKMVLEAMKRQQLIPWLETEDQRMAALAWFFPPPGQQPNAVAMTIIKEAFEIRAEKQHKPPGGDEGRAPGAAPGVVMTATEKETLEKTLILAKKIKIPRFVDRPYDALYPPTWLTMLETKTADDVYQAWRVRMEQVFQHKPVMHTAASRVLHLDDLMLIWFHDLPAGTTIDTITERTTRTWFHYIESYLEVFIISGVISLSGSVTTATASFSAHLRSKWSSFQLIDLHAALKVAAETKDTVGAASATAAPTKNFFRGRGSL